MKSFGRLMVVFMIGLLLPTATLAERVTSFDSVVTVSADNAIKVVETIAYDPEGESHHGIFRYVPTQFSDGAGNTYYTKIKFDSVTDEAGQSYPIAAESNDSKQLYLKIGDANVTFTTPKTYIITYEISPLALRAGDHDRLIFNITGEGWGLPIDAVTASLNMPAAATSATCYTGAVGSTATDCSISVAGNMVNVTSSRSLSAGEGVTVDLNLPANSFSAYLQPNVKPPLTPAAVLAIILDGLVALALIVGLGIDLKHWLAVKRARSSQPVIAQYDPPDGLAPAQMAVLDKNRNQAVPVTATIIDLGVRGYIQIEQTQAKSWWRSADYAFTKVKNGAGLESYEVALFNQIFVTGDKVTLLSFRGKPAMASAVQSFRSGIGKSLEAKGYYYLSPTFGWGVVRWVAAVGTVILVPVSLYGGDQPSLSWALLAVFAAAVALGLALKNTGMTELGVQEWAKVEGFKLFLKVTEADRLKFFNSPSKMPKLTPELFSKFLSYAIALGVEKEWAGQFAGIDVSEAVGHWYVGAYMANLSAGDFATSMSGAFNSAVSSNFAGASGAGGAGGGGGGGGGGGW